SVLEILLVLDLLRRRAHPRLSACHVRAAGLRVRREAPRRTPRARDLERLRLRRSAGAAGGRPQTPLQPRLLGRGRPVLRACPRQRGQAGRCLELEQRPPALERHRRQVEGEDRRRPPARAEALLRLGRAHPGRGRGPLHPIGYHVGTVWPFDTSFIAWGLGRYGFKQEAAVLAAGILDAAEVFEGRLPEAFGGYERGVTKYPVQYPTACSPQAWSTGAPLLLVRTMLGLEPVGDHLVVD